MRQSCSKVSAGLAYPPPAVPTRTTTELRMNRASPSSSSQTLRAAPRTLCIQYSRSVCTFCVVIASSLSGNAVCCECQDQECRRQKGVGGVWAEDKQHGTVNDCNSGWRCGAGQHILTTQHTTVLLIQYVVSFLEKKGELG